MKCYFQIVVNPFNNVIIIKKYVIIHFGKNFDRVAEFGIVVADGKFQSILHRCNYLLYC